MKRIMLIPALVALMSGCTHNPAPAPEQENKHEQHHHDAEAAPGSNAVLLNNGAKWNANAETTQGIQQMIALTERFPNDPTPADYLGLKTAMETTFNGILKQCTMTGEAHNQLHNYLLPMKAMFEGLGSPDMETCKSSFEQLKQHLPAYQDYFQ